jgi:hypothetical protein
MASQWGCGNFLRNVVGSHSFVEVVSEFRYILHCYQD